MAIVAVLAIGFFSYRSQQSRAEAVSWVEHTKDVLQLVEQVASTMTQAETAQRGYLLTGEVRYIDQYNRARALAPVQMQRLVDMVADNPEQQRRARSMSELVALRLNVAAETVQLQQAGDTAGAFALLKSGRGVAAMDSIRDLVREMSLAETRLLEVRQRTSAAAERAATVVTWAGAGTLLVLIAIAAYLLSRDFRARESLAWMRMGQMGLAARLQGEQRLDQLGEQVAAFLAGYLGAHVGAVYAADGAGTFRRIGGFALPPGNAFEVRDGSGLTGQAVKENRALHVTDVPAGYLPVSSALGATQPRELLVSPASVDGKVQAVIELGFLRRVLPVEREFLERVSEILGVAVRASRDRTQLEALLEETQRQAEELQTQQEELRVNNEELEEQSRALKESQARLETQQVELEQINTNLEEQTQLLEAQRDDLTRAQVLLSDKASELARANQYKSEFLANMSHELRTPLNSALILATLLADNRDGNLTEEQVTFARTIYDAGNDLLALINDVLDLSKIEAGKVELSVEPVAIVTTVDSLVKTFEPLARQKQLAFAATVDPAVPQKIESDSQRLGQVLKNLLSNAIKFTERGTVTLRVTRPDTGTISFAVEDSGIGIAPQQQQVIFEAFRQADGSTHRKYGGTGLGLSISRDLAHLLGGDLKVQSESGRGSVFTLTLPIAFRAAPGPRPSQAAAVAAAPAPRPSAPALAASAAPIVNRPAIDDDRDVLTPGSRRLLIVEDDLRFAGVLRDLAREKGFQTLITHTAADGLAAAGRFGPHAILLDVNLPDTSGLSVLDQLKRDPHTRHLPVHVISVEDHAQLARERGAIGYAFKPVRREDVLEALQRIETKLTQGLRRVLVVEDDARQRESIQQLLAADNVAITGAATAAEALDHLTRTTFDCVVMDLTLPDLSGAELLERMAAQDEVSFPPVIVYTGRSLTADEEQQLRRFSKSIIIKDARSPERLLDEVTLFLHQVEATMPMERQRMLKAARDRDTALEHRRVLIVDDDARNIFALSRVLEPRGAKVDIARNGREALAALDKSAAGGARIDLVLMDIMMPEMDGLTAMTEIRRRPAWKALPIIALTAKAMQDDQEKCRAAGANDYIAKPFDVEKLLSLIRVWMPK